MEDLAIRYADAHADRVARSAFAETTDACMTKLFAVIGNYHGVAEGQIRQWIGRRNLIVDLGVFVSFCTARQFPVAVCRKGWNHVA
jgi:hypothetical protein